MQQTHSDAMESQTAVHQQALEDMETRHKEVLKALESKNEDEMSAMQVMENQMKELRETHKAHNSLMRAPDEHIK